MTRRRLPIGMQTFREVREENCYYVDKTAYIRRLLDQGKHYFLSRPRRFGKSLFLDTCKELLEGNEPLFEGLAIHEEWDWSVRRPVLRLSFGGGNFKEQGYLHENLMALLFRNREFDAYWFETGTPTFLVETLLKRGVSPLTLDGMTGSAGLLGTFDVDRIEPAALLFQTGYLTILATESRGGRTRYRLGYPNREVLQSLNESLLEHLTRDPRREHNGDRLADLLAEGDVAALEDLFRAFFAGIPYEWHTNNDVARFEAYYASVFYAYFASVLGPAVTVEDSGSRGRADMAVRTGGRVYLFEFKVVEQAAPGTALAQLKTRAYADKYRALGAPIHLVAVEFSSASRNVVAFEHETA